jgi:hypothetical protein
VNKAKKVPQPLGDEMRHEQFDSTPDLSVCAEARENPADLSIPPFLKRSAGLHDQAPPLFAKIAAGPDTSRFLQILRASSSACANR